MIIRKEYKFYAAHRNETLQDKCSNIHGHRYGLRIHFEVERAGDISTLFGDFDEKIEPWLKQNYDHGMLINRNDPLFETLQQHSERTGESFRLKVIDGPSSVENLAWVMFTEITEMGFRLSCLEIQETDTSTLLYTREDWVRDNRHFAKTTSDAERGTHRRRRLNFIGAKSGGALAGHWSIRIRFGLLYCDQHAYASTKLFKQNPKELKCYGPVYFSAFSL